MYPTPREKRSFGSNHAALAKNYGLSLRRLNEATALVRSHANEFRAAWKKHFRR